MYPLRWSRYVDRAGHPAGEVAVQVVVVEQLTEVSAVARRPPWSSPPQAGAGDGDHGATRTGPMDGEMPVTTAGRAGC